MTTQKCCLCETPCEYHCISPILHHYKCDNCGEFLISTFVQVERLHARAEKEKVAKFACQRKTETDKPKPFVLYVDAAELHELSNKDRFDLFQWDELVSRPTGK